MKTDRVSTQNVLKSLSNEPKRDQSLGVCCKLLWLFFSTCSMRLGVPFIAPRSLGLVGSSFGKQSAFPICVHRTEQSAICYLLRPSRLLHAFDRMEHSTRYEGPKSWLDRGQAPDAVTTCPTQSRLAQDITTRPRPTQGERRSSDSSEANLGGRRSFNSPKVNLGGRHSPIWFWFTRGQSRWETLSDSVPIRSRPTSVGDACPNSVPIRPRPTSAGDVVRIRPSTVTIRASACLSRPRASRVTILWGRDWPKFSQTFSLNFGSTWEVP
jgi:hypothetical protein